MSGSRLCRAFGRNFSSVAGDHLWTLMFVFVYAKTPPAGRAGGFRKIGLRNRCWGLALPAAPGDQTDGEEAEDSRVCGRLGDDGNGDGINWGPLVAIAGPMGAGMYGE